jgi:hypothetical protein
VEQTARERWWPEVTENDQTPRRRRKQAMADTLRDLIEDVLFLDVESADETRLTEAEEALAKAHAVLASEPGIPDRNLHVWPVDNLHSERSPFVGRSNALAAPMRLWFEGDLTYGEATYGDAYEGPPGSVHGGHVIAAFDDLLGVAQSASGIAGLTGTLSVKLLNRTPLGQRIDYVAGVREVSGRKVMAWGEARLGDTVLAEATGIFIEPRGGHPARAMREAAGLPFPSAADA